MSTDSGGKSLSTSKKKRKAAEPPPDMSDEEEDLHAPYHKKDHIRSYPNNSPGTVFPVYIESINEMVKFGNKDPIYLNTIFSRYNKGVKEIKRVNALKYAILFDNAKNANSLLTNKEFLVSHEIKAFIPASTSESTGVIKFIPTNLSCKHLFDKLISSQEILSVRRFTKKTPEGIVPLQTVAITFSGSKDDSGDYSLILASNRDEYYDRPASNMVPWEEDPNVYGGRDLQEGCDAGTWLALSPVRKKLGVLLNLPGSTSKTDAKSRGKLVADYVKSNLNTKDYIDNMSSYIGECNEFVLITIEFGESTSSVYSYSNASKSLTEHNSTYLGFGNSLPGQPLKKVEAGRQILEEICSRFNKIEQRKQLVNELLQTLLKSSKKHLPDPELEKRKPELYKQLSSIFVCIPPGRYGTRTHTLVLVTKAGHVETIEVSMLPPIDPLNPKWHTTEYQFDL